MRTFPRLHVVSLLALASAACGEASLESVATSESALSAQPGHNKFTTPQSHTNGRACSTCHVESQHTALNPADVVSRFAQIPATPCLSRSTPTTPRSHLQPTTT